MARPGSMRPCARRDTRRAVAALNGSCVIIASGRKPRGNSGCVPRTAITICPFQHIGYIRCVHFAPNRLDRNFAVERPNQVWLAGIAYVPSDEGWLTLAAVLDPCTRKIIGWAMRDRMRAELTTAALTMAVQRQKPPQGLIHHSGRGSQYATAFYHEVPVAAGMIQSMSRKGDCRDCESVGALGGPDPCCD